MGDDKYETIEATPVTYFGKNYSFHIEKECPLSKNGIIGLSFFNKFPRYAITQKFLVIDECKLPIYYDGEYIPKNSQSAKICKLQIDNEDDQVVRTKNQKGIPHGLYSYVINNNKFEIPLHDFDKMTTSLLG